MWALLAHHCCLPYFLGKPLGPILAKYKAIVSHIEEGKQIDHIMMVKIMWHLFRRLKGDEDATKNLISEVLAAEIAVPMTALHAIFCSATDLEVFLILGNYSTAAEIAISNGDAYGKAFPGFFIVMIVTFHRALACFAMARRSKAARYRRHAYRVRKTIQKWSDSGNPNVKYYCTCLDAEHAVLSKKYEKAKTYYQESIRVAARNGYLHHAALINERYADFAGRILLDEEECRYRTREAIHYYREWGAFAKVKMLEKDIAIAVSSDFVRST